MVATYVVLLFTPLVMRESTRLLIAWNVGGAAYIGLIALMMFRPTADPRVDARPEDENQWVLLLLGVFAAIAALAAIVWELGPVKTMEGLDKAEHLALVGGEHSQRLDLHPGDVRDPLCGRLFRGGRRRRSAAAWSFPGKPEPGWTEFVYQAFVVGCTFASSDINVDLEPDAAHLRRPGRRRVLLQHHHSCPRHQHRGRVLLSQSRRPDRTPMTEPNVTRRVRAALPRGLVDRDRRRHRRRRGDDGEDPQRLCALRLRGGRDAVHRIHRGARQVPARPGPAERGRVLVQGRRRAMAVAALRPDRAARPLRRRELRQAAEALPQLSRRLGVPQREAGAGPLPPVHAVRRRYGRRGERRRATPKSA